MKVENVVSLQVCNSTQKDINERDRFRRKGKPLLVLRGLVSRIFSKEKLGELTTMWGHHKISAVIINPNRSRDPRADEL